jgi:hypothetical protein
LGGKFSNNFKKSANPILISPVAEGKKYDAAILWGLPDWLLECYEMKKRVNEEPYLVGKMKPSNKNSVVEDSQDSMLSPTHLCDKRITIFLI